MPSAQELSEGLLHESTIAAGEVMIQIVANDGTALMAAVNSLASYKNEEGHVAAIIQGRSNYPTFKQPAKLDELRIEDN
jgi:hypothetical protein